MHLKFKEKSYPQFHELENCSKLAVATSDRSIISLVGRGSLCIFSPVVETKSGALLLLEPMGHICFRPTL